MRAWYAAQGGVVGQTINESSDCFTEGGIDIPGSEEVALEGNGIRASNAG